MKGGIPTPKLSADQRKALADMLGPKGDARRRAQAKYTNARDQREETLVKETAEENGATELVEKIAELRTRIAESKGELDHLVSTLREAHGQAERDFTREIDESEEELTRLGFDANEAGDLSLNWGAHELRRTIHEQIEHEIGTEADIEQKFDQARAKVLTAETPEKAAKIVASLL